MATNTGNVLGTDAKSENDERAPKRIVKPRSVSPTAGVRLDPTAGNGNGNPEGIENRKPDPDNHRDETRTETKQTGQTETTLEFEGKQEVSPKRGRRSKQTAETKSSKTKATKQDSEKAAQGLLEIVQFLAVAYLGAEAALTPIELFLIQEPLGRMIEKYGAVADRFSGLIDPILVVAGGVIYGSRLASLNAVPVEHFEDKPQEYPVRTEAKPDQPPSASPEIFGIVGSAHK